jgi:hypothetical protein
MIFSISEAWRRNGAFTPFVPDRSKDDEGFISCSRRQNRASITGTDRATGEREYSAGDPAPGRLDPIAFLKVKV